MPRVLVFHYDPSEAPGLAQRVRSAGFDAQIYPKRGVSGLLSRLADNPPDAILIDLMQMPSYGRAVGVLLRQGKATRRIPLVFVEGDPQKTALVRTVLPDAVIAKLTQIGPAIARAIRQGPAEPAAPRITAVPASRKLRIQPGAVVALLHAPEGFSEILHPLPKGAAIRTKTEGASVVLAVFRSMAALGIEFPKLERELRAGRALWLVWPKKSSGQASDLSLPRIVEMCSARGFTGYLACAVDDTWSAVAVAVRRGSPAAAAKMGA